MALLIFVDGSSCPTAKVGYGAALGLAADDDRSADDLKEEVAVRRFCPCSSSSLELVTLLWALESRGEDARESEVFTDSQTIVGLAARRGSLEASGFRSRSGRLLNHSALYREYFDAMDRLGFSVVKVAGHKSRAEKTAIDLRFTLVDRASRLALRRELR